MSTQPQKFLIDFLRNRNVSVPSHLLGSSFVVDLEDIGYEIPDEANFQYYMDAMNDRYSSRVVVPIAHSSGSDDTIAVVISGGIDEKPVIHFHNFADPGWEGAVYYTTIEECLHSIKES